MMTLVALSPLLNLLKKIFLNKYTLGLLIVGGSLWYIHSLIETNVELELRAKALSDSVASLELRLSEERDLKLKQEIILTEDCEARLSIVNKNKDFIKRVEVQSQVDKGKEKVDEKDVLNTKLPESILNGLRYSDRVR